MRICTSWFYPSSSGFRCDNWLINKWQAFSAPLESKAWRVSSVRWAWLLGGAPCAPSPHPSAGP